MLFPSHDRQEVSLGSAGYIKLLRNCRRPGQTTSVFLNNFNSFRIILNKISKQTIILQIQWRCASNRKFREVNLHNEKSEKLVKKE